VTDEPPEAGDSDLRRRAAWLFAMLVVVAGLIVLLMTTLLHADKGSGGTPIAHDPITQIAPAPSSAQAPSSSEHAPSSSSSASSPSAPNSSSSASSTASGATGCPTDKACTLDSDVGNATAAINAYRAQHNLATVPVTVSGDAEKCALQRGDGCSGGWAETEIPAPADGAAAVAKIVERAKLTESNLKGVEIGWAFDPGSKTYYFVTIRQD
jgi:cytoskeletal protein RodZ